MNVHSLKSTEVVPLCFIIFKSYIPRGIVFVLRQQLSVRQVKCAGNANYSTYILYGILIIIRYIGCHVP